MENKNTLDQYASGKLEQLTRSGLRRFLVPTSREKKGTAGRGGRSFVSFSCNDYLGLSQNPQIKAAAAEALMEFGAGAGASRLVTGNSPIYRRLEESLARIKSTEGAVVFGSGYLANLGVIPVFVGSRDLCLVDELAHSSMHAGIKASGAQVILFAHNDLDDCRQKLSRQRAKYQHCMILSEGVFSMDGDRAPLIGLSDLADEFDSWLFIDDAHGFGVLGDGAGSVVEAGMAGRVHLQMGTLSKSVGSYGGFLCGSGPVCDLLVNRARSLIYETGLPPASLAASLAALDFIETHPSIVARPLKLARRFTQELALPMAQSAIVPFIIGSPQAALAASSQLEALGFLITAIRPPTVPEGTARLRFTFCANHTDEDVSRLIKSMQGLGFTG